VKLYLRAGGTGDKGIIIKRMNQVNQTTSNLRTVIVSTNQILLHIRYEKISEAIINEGEHKLSNLGSEQSLEAEC
jgi:hypothetical protein